MYKSKQFPFPDRNLAYKELKRDPVYNKIPQTDINSLIEHAWNAGVIAADYIKEQYQEPFNFLEIAQSHDLKVEDIDIDRIVGKQRFFSEYITKRSLITMYTKSIEKWAQTNHLPYDDAYNLILGHEFFHFLEYTKYGYTSKKYLVPMLKIGNIELGKTGIRALSEIGAHAFVNQLFVRGK